MDSDTNSVPLNKYSSQFLIIGILLIIGVIGLGLYVSQNKSPISESSSTSTTESKSAILSSLSNDLTMKSETSPAMDGETIGNTFEVEGGGFYYKPNEIRVKKGEKVTITLNSVDMVHDFVIDEFNVKSEVIPAGETTSVTFTPNTVGSFEFYCSVGKHRQMGMLGKLVME